MVSSSLFAVELMRTSSSLLMGSPRTIAPCSCSAERQAGRLANQVALDLGDVAAGLGRLHSWCRYL
jgi:hypothetical protein